MNISKISHYGWILVFVFLSSFSVNSQCLINNLRILQTQCDVDGRYMVEINFDHNQAGIDSFRIMGNGINYGLFSYNKLPISLGPFSGDCQTIREFAVRDMANPNCLAFKGLGKVCCVNTCSISISEITPSVCNGNLYDIELNLEHNQSDDRNFILYNNGQLFGQYDFTEFPLKINNLISSNFNTFNEIIVCTTGPVPCCDTTYVLNPCICTIYNTRYRISACDEESGTFSVKLDFEHNLTAQQFQLGGNGINYGIFNYSDLPVTITGLKLDSILEYELLILDQNNTFCFESIDLGIVNTCPESCTISELNVEVTECVQGQFFANISFLPQNVGFDGFDVKINGMHYGHFNYGQDIYSVGPLDVDCLSLYSFEIVDTEINTCHNSFTLDSTICCNLDCKILHVAIIENCENNDLISFDLYFDVEDEASESFILQINEQASQIFKYADLPITITNLDFGLPDVEILIVDSVDTSCVYRSSYAFKCFPVRACSINNLTGMVSTCDDNKQFEISLDFSVVDAGENGFEVFVNDTLAGIFSYGQNPYVLGPFDGDCENIYQFTVIDKDDTNCRSQWVINSPICCPSPCFIGTELSTDFSICQNGVYDLTVDFDFGFVSDSLYVYLNNLVAGKFAYSELPVVISSLLENTEYVLKIEDLDFPDCSILKLLPEPECTSSTKDKLPEEFNILQYPDRIELYHNESSEDFKVFLFNILGQNIQLQKSNAYVQISKNQLTSGWYVLKILRGKSEYTFRFYIL